MSIRYTLLAIGLLLTTSSFAKSQQRVSSPDGHLVVTAGVNPQGQPWFSLSRDGQTVLSPSTLGFTLREGDMQQGFKVKRFFQDTNDETWQQPWGEERLVRNHYNELRMNLAQSKGSRFQLNIIFRVFNDGIGFRYEFPRQSGLQQFVITEEATRLVMPFDATAWTQKTVGTHYYEGYYEKGRLSEQPMFSTPAPIEVNDSLYLVLHEANLTDYSSLNYQPTSTEEGITLKSELIPWSNGDLVRAETPFCSPWRTLIVADKPGDLITSRLELNLNEPCRIDTTWLETGKYVGIWWGMHQKDFTWEQGPKHGATTEYTREYIDFAAENGMKGVLVEGWNYGWDGDWTRIDNDFSYTKAYPDYDLEGLQKYALSRGVRLIAHNETGGAAQKYEDQMDEAFAYYHKLGINAIKTGYVNMQLDGKENQHSQYGVQHYRHVVEAAAKHHIMVVNHEPAMPTGLRRTYPNLISGEGMRGQEYNAWSRDGGNRPNHVCLLPFTRGLAGPMDFTPGIFNFSNPVLPETHPQTTLAKQLAEYVVLYAPWQMAADQIKNYAHQPAFQFIRDVATDWERTVVPAAKIGEYLVTARQERGTDNWFVGGVTDGQARDLTFSLDFLDSGLKYKAVIYKDGPAADYRTNPYDLTISQMEVTSESQLSIHLAPSGGFAIALFAIE